MSCEFCDLERVKDRDGFEPHGDHIVGQWAFTKDDDMMHRACGRVNLWYDFDEDEWALVVLIANDMAMPCMPAVAQLHPKVCPMCGRKL